MGFLLFLKVVEVGAECVTNPYAPLDAIARMVAMDDIFIFTEEFGLN